MNMYHDIIEAIDNFIKTKYHLYIVTPSYKVNIIREKEKSFSQSLDEWAAFYALYGLLDGISVTYSSLKYFCEVLTTTSIDYRALLINPIWFAIILSAFIFIASLSMCANYLEKYKPETLNTPLELFWDNTCIQLIKINLSKYWDYLRNMLKGAKNGFKGTKSFIALFLTLDILTQSAFKSIVFPISISISIICAVNRYWNIGMNRDRKQLNKRCKVSINKVKKLNEFLEKKQELKYELSLLISREKKIEKIRMKAERLGVSSFELDNSDPASSNTLPSLRGFQSEPNFKSNQSEKRLKDNIIFKAQCDELLFSPEIQDKKELILALEKALSQEKLPKETSNVKHPLVEKLIKEKKSLLALEKVIAKNETCTFAKLKSKINEKDLLLTNCILEQKSKDRVVIKKWLDEHEDSTDILKEFQSIIHLSELSQLSQSEHINFKFENNFKVFFSNLSIIKKQLKINIAAQNLIEIKRLRLEASLYKEQICKLFDTYKITDVFRAKIIFRELEFDKLALKQFLDDTKIQLLLSNIIAGIVDAPYLYVGIMSLAIISSYSILLSLTLCIISFTLISVFFRAYEEIDKRKKDRIELLKASIIECDNEWKIAQNNYYKVFEKFKLAHNIEKIDGTKFSKVFLIYSKKTLPNLIQTYNASQLERLKLKTLVMPSYYGALMYGAKDALAFFGAIANFCFALNIIFLLTGIAFSPVLIITAVTIGLFSLVGFISYRFSHTYWVKKQLDICFQAHLIEINTDEFKHDIPSFCLGWSDSATDGLTKGEFFFQDIFEVLRSLFSGMGKSNNLIDLFFGSYKQHAEDGSESFPLMIMVSFIVLALFYGGVLALRAINKGIKIFSTWGKDIDKENKISSNEKILEKSSFPEGNKINFSSKDNEQKTSLYGCNASLFNSHEKGKNRFCSSPPLFNLYPSHEKAQVR